jgi:hypothetical protein
VIRSPQLFSYIVDHDTGYAPNPFDKLCTLAGCKFCKNAHSRSRSKPKRKNIVELAEAGDWIVGLGGSSKRSSGPGTLVYAMKVKEAIRLRDYCQQHKKRADAQPARNQPWRKALIASRYYYFGRHAVKLKPSHYAILKVGRGFKNDFSENFIVEFVGWLTEQTRPQSIEPCVAIKVSSGKRLCRRSTS